MPTLVATSGPLAGQRFVIEKEITLGREAGLVLPEEEASRRHATVRPDGRGIVIEDLGSLNGTFVDGRRIEAPVTLTGGETIRIGACEFQLEADPEPEPEAAPADPGATRLHAAPLRDDATVVRARPAPADPGATTVRKRPAPPPPPAPAAEPAAPPAARAPAASAAPPAQPFGALAPRGAKLGRRPRAAATRLIVPAFASYAVIVLTAVALVLYFASR